MKTTAAVLRCGHGEFSIEEIDVADPLDDEVLVRMVATGMCHTDLLSRELPPEFFAGPQVYGHEGAGVVEAVGAGVTDLVPGDHVVLSFNSCGTCLACDGGEISYCFDFNAHNVSGGRPDGSSAFVDAAGERIGSHFFGQSSFAHHTLVARRSVVKVDTDLDLARLGPLGCGIQTGAGAVMNTLDVQPGGAVVVAGAGALGLAAVMAAKVVGAEHVIAIDRHANRLELAERYGATATLSVDPAELPDAIMEITGGVGAGYAFDTTGNEHVVKGVFDGLHRRGTLGIAGVGFGQLVLEMPALVQGRTLTGVMEGDAVPEEFIPKLARLNADGEFPFDELIGEFALADINTAEAASADGSVVKPVLVF